MRKFFFITLFLSTILFAGNVYSQDFPVKEWQAASHDKPFIFYLSGDGGFNKFSNSLCDGFNKKGYDVAALNSKSYFWEKKTPEQAANDVNTFLIQKITGRANQQIVLIGYSFGADVLPFIINKMPKEMRNKIIVSYLMASSGSTDFEIHWSDIFGGNAKRSMDVVSEINKLTNDKIVIINGSDDKDLEVNKISIKYKYEVLPGGHHFDGDTDEIIKVIVTDMF